MDKIQFKSLEFTLNLTLINCKWTKFDLNRLKSLRIRFKSIANGLNSFKKCENHLEFGSNQLKMD